MASSKRPQNAKSAALRQSSRDTQREMQEAALAGAVNDAAAHVLTNVDKEIATALGITEAEASRAGVNVRLPVMRKLLAEKQGDIDLSSEMSDEAYEALVRFNFGTAVLVGARLPCTLREEADRYIEAVRALQSTYPQGRRTKGERIRIAVEMRNQDKSWTAVYSEVLQPPITPDDKRRLRNNVNAHLSKARKQKTNHPN